MNNDDDSDCDDDDFGLTRLDTVRTALQQYSSATVQNNQRSKPFYLASDVRGRDVVPPTVQQSYSAESTLAL